MGEGYTWNTGLFLNLLSHYILSLTLGFILVAPF